MRRFNPKYERAEDFSNGNLVWLQEIIEDNDGYLLKGHYLIDTVL